MVLAACHASQRRLLLTASHAVDGGDDDGDGDDDGGDDETEVLAAAAAEGGIDVSDESANRAIMGLCQVSVDCPVMLAAGKINGGVLETIMRFTPAIWIGDRESRKTDLALLLRLIYRAMETPSAACVALLMGNCIALQRRLLPLMHHCVSTHRDGLLPIVCRHARIDTERQGDGGNTLLHELCALANHGNTHGDTLLKALLKTRPRLHLFAPDAHGLTALAYARGGCLDVLLDATR
eukprot:223302-Prymnesium_polylepis.1